ncbi:MAG: hypothetical protein KDB66_02710 [Solirubrobacterales bacterium]|nr:hypothetical protein [Solirubrobacterales bacterium]
MSFFTDFAFGVILSAPNLGLPVGRTVSLSNEAVTDLASLIVTLQVPVPVQAPDQPVNDEPVPAVGVNVTSVPKSKSAVQLEPQFTPAGAEVTVPEPAPDFETVKVLF